MSELAVQVMIKGRVQGVFFRAETQKAAESHHLAGYVKNMPDGSVQALFQGSQKDIDLMIDWCWKGSPHSLVEGVNSTSVPVQTGLSGFEIQY